MQMDDLIIKNKKGRRMPLKADKERNHVILSRKSDNSPIEKKRRVKVYIINDNKFEEFQKVKISAEKEKSILGKFFEVIWSLSLFK